MREIKVLIFLLCHKMQYDLFRVIILRDLNRTQIIAVFHSRVRSEIVQHFYNRQVLHSHGEMHCWISHLQIIYKKVLHYLWHLGLRCVLGEVSHFQRFSPKSRSGGVWLYQTRYLSGWRSPPFREGTWDTERSRCPRHYGSLGSVLLLWNSSSDS